MAMNIMRMSLALAPFGNESVIPADRRTAAKAFSISFAMLSVDSKSASVPPYSWFPPGMRVSLSWAFLAGLYLKGKQVGGGWREWRNGRRRCDRQDASGQFTRMHVRIEKGYELVKVFEKAISEDERVGCAVDQFDLRGVDHYFG